MKYKKIIVFLLTALLLIGLLACSNDDSADKGTVKLAIGNWAEGIAITNLAAVVLEDHMGYKAEITIADVAPIFTSVANGNTDAFLDSWLPVTHESYMDEYGDNLDDLGIINDNASIGLVVPEYVEINSLEELADSHNADMFNGEIIGIDAGAGMMKAAERAIEEYGIDLQLVTSSEAAMTVALDRAIGLEEPIVVVGWTPHWKFAEYDLKFLEDPKGIYGDSEDIHALGRLGLEEDMPEVYSFLSNYTLTDDQLADLMSAIFVADDDMEAARTWMKENEDVVSQWIE